MSGLVKTGVIGSIVAALCCFTPLLPVLLGAFGLNGLLGALYNDAILLPILAGFLILTGVALWLDKRRK